MHCMDCPTPPCSEERQEERQEGATMQNQKGFHASLPGTTVVYSPGPFPHQSVVVEALQIVDSWPDHCIPGDIVCEAQQHHVK